MAPGQSNDPGEYRAIYAAILHDAAYQALTPAARGLLFQLKLMLHFSGIGHLYQEQLLQASGLTPKKLESAVCELIRNGWIERDNTLYWLVNGYRFEVGLNPGKRKNVERHIAGLRGPLVSRWMEKYEDFAKGAPKPSLKPSGKPSPKPSGKGVKKKRPSREGSSRQKLNRTEQKGEAPPALSPTEGTHGKADDTPPRRASPEGYASRAQDGRPLTPAEQLKRTLARNIGGSRHRTLSAEDLERREQAKDAAVTTAKGIGGNVRPLEEFSFGDDPLEPDA